MSVETLIQHFILENFLFTDETEQLPLDASFLEEGVVDSTGILEMVMFIEEAFNLAVDDEEIVPENFDSVQQLARYVRMKTGKLTETPNVSEPLPA